MEFFAKGKVENVKLAATLLKQVTFSTLKQKIPCQVTLTSLQMSNKPPHPPLSLPHLFPSHPCSPPFSTNTPPIIPADKSHHSSYQFLLIFQNITTEATWSRELQLEASQPDGRPFA
ncbi:MAG: hypothetical protein IJZ34_10730 [Lachnospiraceae bacterium]|nr:hypothetical protein [Lachnospiraceae bacterium]